MNFDKLKSQIEEATREAFIEMVAKHKAEGIYAFALYSDDGAMTVCPATNTLEKLKNADSDDLAYYKFSEAEWMYEGEGADAKFKAICTLVREKVIKKGDDEKWFEDFQNKLYETCIEVLENLKNEGFFKSVLDVDIFLNFEVTEYEFRRKKVKEIISRLNGDKYKNEYFEWMKTWGK